MKTMKIIVENKTVEFTCNNSGWISDPLPEGFSWDKIRELPRISVGANGAPRVQIGDKTPIVGWQGWTNEEKAQYQEYKKGHKGNGGTTASPAVSSITAEVLADVLRPEVMKILSKETVSFLLALDPRVVGVAKALGKNTSELTPEMLKALGILG